MITPEEFLNERYSLAEQSMPVPIGSDYVQHLMREYAIKVISEALEKSKQVEEVVRKN